MDLLQDICMLHVMLARHLHVFFNRTEDPSMLKNECSIHCCRTAKRSESTKPKRSPKSMVHWTQRFVVVVQQLDVFYFYF